MLEERQRRQRVNREHVHGSAGVKRAGSLGVTGDLGHRFAAVATEVDDLGLVLVGE